MLGEVLTAFIISAGGSLVAVIATGGAAALNRTAFLVAAIFGAISAAKDYRSLKMLPPVPDDQKSGPTMGGPGGAGKLLSLVLLSGLLSFFVVGCVSFVNDAQRSLYVAGNLADGGMKTYAAYWKDQTNRLGDTPELELQRSNVMVLSIQVGTGISLADQALQTYQGNVGTNTTTKAVVTALLQTAVERAGSFAGYIGSLTGNTNFANFSHP